MKTITIDDDVFVRIDKLGSGIFTHSDVIRKLLDKSLKLEERPTTGEASHRPEPQPKSSLIAFVQSDGYMILYKAIDKYLAVLRWLWENRQSEFSKVENYQRGNRVYFAKSQKAVEDGGGGSITARQIPKTPIWTLATLDNRAKRVILKDILRSLNFPAVEINQVVETIPDSGRHRGE